MLKFNLNVPCIRIARSEAKTHRDVPAVNAMLDTKAVETILSLVSIFKAHRPIGDKSVRETDRAINSCRNRREERMADQPIETDGETRPKENPTESPTERPDRQSNQ